MKQAHEEICITPEELQNYQTEINELTVRILGAVDGTGIGTIIPATMNVLLNMFMELKRNPDVGAAGALASFGDVRRMVEYIDAKIKDEPVPEGTVH